VGRALYTPGVSAQRFLQPGPIAQTASKLGDVASFFNNQSPFLTGASTGFLPPKLFE